MKHVITWRRKDKHLNAFGRRVPCSCIVRNELNGWRKQCGEIVTTIPDGQPFYPRKFPVGKWEVFTPRKRTDPFKAPYYIPTNATQAVPTWRVQDGCYTEPSGETAVDEAYGLHHSTSGTTLGCIKIEDRDDLLWMVERINDSIARDIRVYLKVTE